jgi:hypothetical protein
MTSKGLVRTLWVLLLFLLPLTAIAAGEIYRVVDENGNVTFTDQKPAGGGEVVDLPPLSVIETDIQVPDKAAQAEAAQAEPAPPTTRELRRKFRDFRIIQPQNEETFWGTANTVVVSWGSSESIPEEMNVVLYVDGEPQNVPTAGSVSLTLDRGEHQVYALLRDARNRRIVTTPTVTFFVKQHSVLFNQPNGSPGG